MTPGLPSNPVALACDSSALIQVLVAERIQSLRFLQSQYAVQPVVTSAVEAEMSYRLSKSFRDQLPDWKKALRGGVIKVIDQRTLKSLGFMGAEALLDQIENQGRDFALTIGVGEAYTHAASNVLEIPTLSHDISAIRELQRQGTRIAGRPIVRVFDLILLEVQAGAGEMADCEKARKLLMKRGEGIPDCFRNCSVRDGLVNFYLRLEDFGQQPIGAVNPIDGFDERVHLRALRRPTGTAGAGKD